MKNTNEKSPTLMLLCCGVPYKKDATLAPATAVDPLPSWNDGVLRSIFAYVEKVKQKPALKNNPP